MKLSLRGLRDPLPHAEAVGIWNRVRVEHGLAPTNPRLLSAPDTNTKLRKGGQYGLSLLPHRLGGVGNLCPASTPGCRAGCLNTAGRGLYTDVQKGRLVRTVLLGHHPRAFSALLRREIERLPGEAAVRLNVFSDIRWGEVWPEVFRIRPDLQFYDYTKIAGRTPPPNYHLTYSASERWTPDQIRDTVEEGRNVTVVLRLRKSDEMPKTYLGLPVVDGDLSDSRYKDPEGVVVGLRAKGRARRDTSGFVREPV
jgi:hypothetical protein